MSPFEHDLLALLKEDSRTPVTTLAAKLSVSRKRIKEGMERLIDRGVIRRFTVEVEADKPSNDDIQAFFHVRLYGPHCAKLFTDIKRYDEIRGSWSISSGELDMLILVACPTQTQVEAVRDKIARHSLVKYMHTTFVLNTWRGVS